MRCLLLRGAGDEAFSSGFDLAEMGQVNGRGERPDEAVERAAEALEAVACPTVAFLNGPAYGGGFELAATCDLRVAREGILLGLPPAKLGVVYPEGGLRRFLQLVGRGAHPRALLLRPAHRRPRGARLGAGEPAAAGRGGRGRGAGAGRGDRAATRRWPCRG